MSLKVSEQFYSLQGEGRTVGVPAIFLRLQGCNLTCGGNNTIKTKELDSGATWRCDTIETWVKGSSFSFHDLVSYWENNDWISFLKTGAHLVITGGEPLLQQDKICLFLDYFYDLFKFYPVVEIETNGTLMPNDDLCKWISFFNVSPKLASSGMVFSDRFKEAVLRKFDTLESSIFKFVVSSEKEVVDIQEEYLNSKIISSNKIYLMPAASNRLELNTIESKVITLCKKYCFNYSTRLHIQIWDNKKGV